MALTNINDNFQLDAPKHLDNRVGNYSSVAEANASIPQEFRIQGLEVVVITAGQAVKYYYRDGVADSDLIPVPTGGAVSVAFADITGQPSDNPNLSASLNNKVDKVAGKGLSTEDYTTAEKNKLAGIQAGAEVNVNADWNATTGAALILNKPTIPAAQVNADWNASTGVAQILNKPTIPTTLPPSGAASGDLSGTYPSPIVSRIHGVDMQSGSPQAGEVWIYGGSPAKWQHQNLTKSDVGLSNVPNLDTSNPANITQSSSYRFVTDAEKSTWNSKQNALTNPVTGTGTNNEIAVFNSTGSTISSLSTGTYPSITELAFLKGVTSAIQAQLNNRSYAVGTFGSSSITIATIGVANLVTISGHGFTIPEADFPVGATIQINGVVERTSGTSGNAGISYDVNGTKRYYIINTVTNAHQLQYQFTIYRESSTAIRLVGGSSATPIAMTFGAANIATATASVTAGGNVVFQLSGWGTVVSEVFAFRFFKAILTR